MPGGNLNSGCFEKLYNNQMKTTSELLILAILLLSCKSIDIVVNGQNYVAFACQTQLIYASQTNFAGTAQICNDDKNLYIIIKLANGYSFAPQAQNVKWTFGYDLDTTVRPIGGKLSFKATATGTYYGVVVLLSDKQVTCLKPFIIFIHLDVTKGALNPDGSLKFETAFAGIPPAVLTKPWFYYIYYKPSCLPPVMPPTDTPCTTDPTQTKCDKKCETAYGYGPTTINSVAAVGNRWGWLTPMAEGQTYSPSIIQGGGGNIITNGEYVGRATYSLQNGLITVSVSLASNCYLTVWHIYADEGIPSDPIANGLFPYTGTASTYNFGQTLILVNNQPVKDLDPNTSVYVIAHFETCCIAQHVVGHL